MKPKSTLRKAVITLPPVRHCVASGNCGSPSAVAKRHFSLSSMSVATSDEPYHSPKPKSRNMIGAIAPSSAARARPMRMPCLHAASRLPPKLSMTCGSRPYALSVRTPAMASSAEEEAAPRAEEASRVERAYALLATATMKPSTGIPVAETSASRQLSTRATVRPMANWRSVWATLASSSPMPAAMTVVASSTPLASAPQSLASACDIGWRASDEK